MCYGAIQQPPPLLKLDLPLISGPYDVFTANYLMAKWLNEELA